MQRPSQYPMRERATAPPVLPREKLGDSPRPQIVPKDLRKAAGKAIKRVDEQPRMLNEDRPADQPERLYALVANQEFDILTLNFL